jgi:DNA-directed RNA polymerase alpha subunit
MIIVMIEKVADLSIRIDDDRLVYGFSNRQLNAMRNFGINTFGDLIKLSRRDLEGISGVGKKGAREIAESCLAMGVCIKRG